MLWRFFIVAWTGGLVRIETKMKYREILDGNLENMFWGVNIRL
jgi:hypothetical protein